MAEGEDVFLAAFAKEERNADSFNQKVEGLLHVVGEGECDAEVFGGRREVGNGVEVTGPVEAGVDETLQDVEMAKDRDAARRSRVSSSRVRR